MAVSYWARNQVGDTFEMSMPGMFCIKLDMCGPGIYEPWPVGYGPICERCWLEDGSVCPVTDPGCYHGGAR